MRGYNRSIIMGNLTRDPELRYTTSRMAVASFSVAVNRSWVDQNGEKRDDVTYVPVVAWGKTAENISRYLRKGSGILVEGRISTRSYEDKSGQKRYVTEVVAESAQFVGGGSDRASSSRPEAAAQNPPADRGEPGDLPF